VDGDVVGCADAQGYVLDRSWAGMQNAVDEHGTGTEHRTAAAVATAAEAVDLHRPRTD